MSECDAQCSLENAWKNLTKVVPLFAPDKTHTLWTGSDWIWATRAFNAHGLSVLEEALYQQDIIWKATHQPYQYELALTMWRYHEDWYDY
jgi:hypothetical protein